MRSDKGFTLIELMIVIVVSSILVTAVYAVHTTQQRTYHAQEQIAEMQQNLRAALFFITSELRMAGYDPQGSGNFGITSALIGRLQWTVDVNEDGVLDGSGSQETIDIGFSTTNDSSGDGIPDSDSDGDGVPDVINASKQTDNAGGYKAFAENIQALEFLYLDSSGAITAVANNIRAIQISILARARRLDQKFMNSMTYTTPSGQIWGPYNDNYRRRMLTTTIRCRNL